MKKWIRVLVSVFLLGNILCSSGVWAIQEPEIGIGSPFFTIYSIILQLFPDSLNSYNLQEIDIIFMHIL